LKPVKRTAVYLITYHDLLDKLGIDARRIVSAEPRPDRKKIDDAALILAVEEETVDE